MVAAPNDRGTTQVRGEGMAGRAAVSCMKNEAMFVVEWVAYHLVCGFDRVGVVTNGCTDGTDAILAQLAAADSRILHVDVCPAPGESPQVVGMKRVFETPGLGDAEWLLHCDADEFLHVTCGAGRVKDLLERMPGSAPTDCIAIAWRPFGDSGLERWEGGRVMEIFTRADRKPRKTTVLHKSMFRPDRFGRAIDHMPKDPIANDIILRNTRGERMNPANLLHPRHARYRDVKPKRMTWANASLNHYAIRSRDLFLMKNLRGDGMGLTSTKYYLNSTFYRRYNRNVVEVPGVAQHAMTTERVMRELRAIGDVAALENEAYRTFVETRDRVLTAEQIDEWTYRQQLAAE
jgi:hypothetical protein